MSPGAYTGECHFGADVMLGDLTRHTHQWGTNFAVWMSGGERDGEQVFVSQDWHHETYYRFESPVRIRAGEGLRYRCEYENDTPRPLRYGTSATDEMCILYGTIWEAEDGVDIGNQDCAIVWTDSEGIAHPADEAGGFPEPAEADIAACLGAAPDDACSQCRCERCATIANQCATDPDCSAISSCFAACAAGEDCGARCLSVLDAHTPGIGSLQQRSGCFGSRCASECQ
jgi:hypothetical protein